MAKEIKNITASFSERLRKYSKEHGEDLQSVLVRFAAQRFLYRLGESEHRERFLLKGAALFTLWFDEPQRPTKDIDLLGSGPADIPTIEDAVKDVCAVKFADGLEFLSGSVAGESILENAGYQGVRIKLEARLGNIRIPLQIDVGTGDAVTPGPVTAYFPALLDLPPASLKVYPKETVVAEKFEAMVRFGMANSRMKDLWDLRYMIAEFEFEAGPLRTAILRTFERRGTALPASIPIALTDVFIFDTSVQGRWSGFIQRNRIEIYTDLKDVIAILADFFIPLVETDHHRPSDLRWNRGRWN